MKYLAKILSWYFIWRYDNKKPDFTIMIENDVAYLYRWWVIPRNKYLNIYLHKVVGDDERYFHDHPWNSVGLILKGAYVEWTPYEQKLYKLNRKLTQSAFSIEVLSQGNVKYRDITYAHYLTIRKPDDHFDPKFPPKHIPVWSLFITGPKKRDWGFYNRQGEWEDHVKWCTDRGREVTY